MTTAQQIRRAAFRTRSVRRWKMLQKLASEADSIVYGEEAVRVGERG